MLLELLFIIFTGWNLISVSEETDPMLLVHEHECVSAIWWVEDGHWRLWDTSQPFLAGDFYEQHEEWAVIKWMKPDTGYWVWCDPTGGGSR